MPTNNYSDEEQVSCSQSNSGELNVNSEVVVMC